MSKSLKSQTLVGVSWSLIGSFSVQAVTFVISIILARLLSPADYGILGMLALFVAICDVFIDGGFSTALIRKKDCDDKDYSTVFYINLGVSLFCYCLLFLAAPFIADFYNQPILVTITRVSCLSLVIGAIGATNNVQLIKKIDFKSKAKIGLYCSVCSGIIGVALAYSGFGVWALVYQALARSAFQTLITFAYNRWIPSLTFSHSVFKEFFAFGSKIIAASLISTIYDNIRTVIIGKKFTPADLGQYTNGFKFPMLLGSTLSGALYSVSFPVLSKVNTDNERLVVIYKRLVSMSAFFLFPTMLILAGVAKPLIQTLLTDKWLECVPYMQILCFAWVYECLTKVNLNLLYVKGRSDLVLRLEIVKKTLAFIILVISCFYGIIGICIGAAVYDFIAFFCNTYYTRKLLNYGFVTQFMQTLPYLLLSLFVMAICLLISNCFSTSVVALIISLLVSVIIYISLAYLFKLSAMFEVIDIAKEYLRKNK